VTATVPGRVDGARVVAARRRTLAVVVTAQVLGGLGLAAGVSVGVLIARQLLDSALLSGLPLAAGTAGGAAAAVGLSRVMARGGRRPGLVTGYLLGALGSVGVVAAAQVESFALLCVAMAVFGSGNVASLLARYAGADLAPARERAAGEGLAAVPPPAGASEVRSPAGSWAAVTRGRAVLGLAAIGVAQFVMVLMMTMTPVHMADHGHGLGVIGFVIGAHIAGMYAFSPLAGWLTDRIGRVATVVSGAGALAAAGVLGGLADPDARAALTVALFLLGLGWSLALVAGSTLLTDSVPLELRAKAQGNADLVVGASATVAGAGSGVVLDLGGWATIATVTAAAALVMAVAVLARHRRPRPAPAGAPG
jgi:MFS family permease